MSAKGFKRMLLGEKMPDKNDPKYRERYEKEVAAGQKFARWTRLDKLVARIQRWANNHRNAFLAGVFAFVAVSFGYNIYRLTCLYQYQQQPHRSVIEVQDSVLNAKRHGVTTLKVNNNVNRRD